MSASNSNHPQSNNNKSNSINSLLTSLVSSAKHITHPLTIFTTGALCSWYLSAKIKDVYNRNFVEPYTLNGAFRDSALHIRSTYRIIKNCLLSEVHVENSTVVIESGVIHKLHINDNSTVILNGGLIKGEIIIIGEKSSIQLNRNSIVEADIYTISPQQLQQKSGLLRGSINIVVVNKENGTDTKQITITSKGRTMDGMHSNSIGTSIPNSSMNMHGASINTMNPPTEYSPNTQQPQYPRISSPAHTNTTADYSFKQYQSPFKIM